MRCGEPLGVGVSQLDSPCTCGHLTMVHTVDGTCDLCAVRKASDELSGRLQSIIDFNQLWDGS